MDPLTREPRPSALPRQAPPAAPAPALDHPRLPGPTGGRGLLSPSEVMHLQRTAGNQATGRLLARLSAGKQMVQRVRVGERVQAAFGDGPPSGDHDPVFYKGRFFGRGFEISATFNPDRVELGGERYITGEYRQYIRGYFWSSESGFVEHHLGEGTTLSATDWQEDGNTRSGKNPYGHRNLADNHGKYRDMGQEGSTYTATDIPSIPVDKGERVEMWLEFRGELIETDDRSEPLGTAPLDQRTWTIQGWCERNKRGEGVTGKLDAPRAQKTKSAKAESSGSGGKGRAEGKERGGGKQGSGSNQGRGRKK